MQGHPSGMNIVGKDLTAGMSVTYPENPPAWRGNQPSISMGPFLTYRSSCLPQVLTGIRFLFFSSRASGVVRTRQGCFRACAHLPILSEGFRETLSFWDSELSPPHPAARLSSALTSLRTRSFRLGLPRSLLPQLTPVSHLHSTCPG